MQMLMAAIQLAVRWSLWAVILEIASVASTLILVVGAALEYRPILEKLAYLLKKAILLKANEFERCILKEMARHSLGPVLVVLGIAGELIFGLGAFIAQDFETTEIQQQAGEAAKSATIAKNAADATLDDLAVLESRVSGRQIFDTLPIKSLRLEGKVVHVMSGDTEEAKAFCRSISVALHDFAGMDTKPACGSSYAESGTIARGPSPSESAALAAALTEATHFHFSTIVPPEWNIPNDELRVLIGPQPSFTIKPTAQKKNISP